MASLVHGNSSHPSGRDWRHTQGLSAQPLGNLKNPEVGPALPGRTISLQPAGRDVGENQVGLDGAALNFAPAPFPGNPAETGGRMGD